VERRLVLLEFRVTLVLERILLGPSFIPGKRRLVRIVKLGLQVIENGLILKLSFRHLLCEIKVFSVFILLLELGNSFDFTYFPLEAVLF